MKTISPASLFLGLLILSHYWYKLTKLYESFPQTVQNWVSLRLVLLLYPGTVHWAEYLITEVLDQQSLTSYTWLLRIM